MGAAAGAIGAAAAIGGLAISAAGAERSAEAQANAANFQAQVAANNKIIAENNKEQATAKGNVQAETAGLKNAATLGAIKAAEGASNVDVNTGSNVDVQKGQREIGDTDAQTIRANAAREAYGYELDAEAATSQGSLAHAAALNAPIAGDLAAGGSFLSGAGSVGQKYAAWRQQTAGSDGSVSAPSEEEFIE